MRIHCQYVIATEVFPINYQTKNLILVLFHKVGMESFQLSAKVIKEVFFWQEGRS